MTDGSIQTGDLAAFTVDLELFSDTMAFRKLNMDWPHEENGEAGVDRLLEIFDRHGIKSTFFVVASHAQSQKSLLRRIAGMGHEISSHSMTHQLFTNQTLESITREVRESKEILEDVIGEAVFGFRAPAFTINEKAALAIEQSGFRYDSSVIPCQHIPGWYGFPRAHRHPFLIRELFGEISGEVMEFPVSTNPATRTPISGLWLRLFGIRYVLWGIHAQIKRREVPVLYVHPWEVVELPRVDGIPWRMHFRTGEKTIDMIETIIRRVNVRFIPLREMLERDEAPRNNANPSVVVRSANKTLSV
ncbi:MAG: polysaccharide deacetylase family protein [Dehalococcoidia bacterium]